MRGSIARTEEWRRIYSAGRKARRDGLGMRALPRPSADLPTRLGLRVRVGRKSGAVRRNRVRRRLRHAFRAAAPSRGWDVAIAADPEVADADCQELTRLITTLLADLQVRS